MSHVILSYTSIIMDARSAFYLLPAIRSWRGISFTLCFFVFFVRSTFYRQPAGLFKPNFACGRTLVPDVSSPLLGVGGGGRKKGEIETFVTMGVNGEFFFPVKRICINKKNVPRKPWITSGLIKSCRKKERSYKCFVKDPCECNKLKYKRYCNRLNSLLHKAEKQYYKEKIELYKSDIKLTWKTIKCILNNGNLNKSVEIVVINGLPVNDKTIIANKFNEYFTNIGPGLANKIPDSAVSPVSYLKGDYKNSFVMYETAASALISVVNKRSK